MSFRVVDLRSDTVTRPTPAMRRAMADAEVGDDVFGDDPTVRRLEERVAELLGKAAALFVPTGTMANQIAVQLHARRGDEALAPEGAHVVVYESAAAAAWGGVQFREIAGGGLFDVEAMERLVQPDAYYLARTRLLVVENTHNRAGGRIFPQPVFERVAHRAHELGLAVHLDGARLWNASVATGRSPEDLAAPADTVSVCFSKGLGAPVGSALAGPAELIAEARRIRKRMGGGMRQAGILCAAALYALDHHVARLAEDHDNARALADALARHGVPIEHPVETNMVVLTSSLPNSAQIVERAAREGVLVGAIDAHRVRCVTHLDVNREGVLRAAEVLARLLAC
ncbi:MAG: low-specificity L-threonine aldolase [Myxococcales bacterium]|nr:low-specificity L-threonine aldolase [Myxococcales bacterium]